MYTAGRKWRIKLYHIITIHSRADTLSLADSVLAPQRSHPFHHNLSRGKWTQTSRAHVTASTRATNESRHRHHSKTTIVEKAINGHFVFECSHATHIGPLSLFCASVLAPAGRDPAATLASSVSRRR